MKLISVLTSGPGSATPIPHKRSAAEGRRRSSRTSPITVVSTRR
jgi:hypothetical protein